MNVFFENANEEIYSVISRAKKSKLKLNFTLSENKISKTRLCSSDLYHTNTDIYRHIDITLANEQGQYVRGVSGRSYLPDLMSRMYQYLENKLKSYKNHKVKKHSQDNSALNIPNGLKYKELGEIIYSNLKTSLTGIIARLENEAVNISINVESTLCYTICQSYSQVKTESVYDSLSLELLFKISSKANSFEGFEITKKFQNSQLNDYGRIVDELNTELIEYIDVFFENNALDSSELSQVKPVCIDDISLSLFDNVNEKHLRFNLDNNIPALEEKSIIREPEMTYGRMPFNLRKSDINSNNLYCAGVRKGSARSYQKDGGVSYRPAIAFKIDETNTLTKVDASGLVLKADFSKSQGIGGALVTCSNLV